MAGDWIKVRCNLHEDPRVVALAAQVEADELHVVGMLWRVWAWADGQSVDGNASITESFLDRLVRRNGFAAALRKVGWLDGRDGLLSFPRFAEHNGQTAKSRASGQKRVAAHRANSVTGIRYNGNAKTQIPAGLRGQVMKRDGSVCQYCGRKEGEVHPTETESDGFMCADHVIPESQGGLTELHNLVCACGKCNRKKAHLTPDEAGMEWTEDVTGKRYGCNDGSLPEKRREEKTNTDPNPPPAVAVVVAGELPLVEVKPPEPKPPTLAELVYQSYPRREGKRSAIKAIEGAIARDRKAGKDPNRLIDLTRAYAGATQQWAIGEERFIPHPATWFNQGRYDDDPKTWMRTQPAKSTGEWGLPQNLRDLTPEQTARLQAF